MRQTLKRYSIPASLILLSMIATALPPVQAAAAEATGDQPATRSYRLDNGLRLIVREDHRSPVVVSQIWYKVGSSYEPSGLTGISHMLEHMMFKGTKRHPPGEFSRIVSANGGRENAFTGRDYTAYFQQLERSRLEISFDLESDRMRNLTLPDEEFAKERQVVLEERRMRTDDNPEALTQELFNATAYLNSGYHHPVIGWQTDIEQYTRADLLDWYRRWYRPDNATLVVVGDVDPEAVLALAQRYFGPVAAPAARPVHHGPTREVEQRGLRRSVIKAPAELPYLLLGYKVPVLHDEPESWEPYALDVLSGILAGGDSARLPSRVVRGRQIAASADAGYDLYARGQELLSLDGTPSQGHTLAELEAALRAEIADLREHPVGDDELERIKAQVVASDVYQRDSVFYQAMEIGMLETVGLGWRVADAYVDRIRAVTADQVQAVARKYLVDDRLTITELHPLPIDSHRIPHHMPTSSTLR